MRCQLLLGSAALMLVHIVCTPRAVAQFTEPTKEELEMKVDPKAPDAAASFLSIEDITDQVAKTRALHERLKVLTEKGKELATMHIPYEPGFENVDIKGRTIHPDGTVFPLTEKPSDLVEVKTKGFQLDALVFTLPNVEVGSILEVWIEEKFKQGVGDPTWMVQQAYFVHKAHYSFKSAGVFGLTYVSRMGSDAKVQDDKKGTYSLDISDIPQIPDEDWMPPLNTIKWRVSFFFSTFLSGDSYWKAAGEIWSKFVLDFTKPTGTLKKATEGIISPGDSETQKAQKIYVAVMKVENSDYTRHKSRAERKKEKIKDIHKAEDVWKEQSGSSDEIALLYVALCRAAGLNVEPMMVVDRSEAMFDEGVLNASQLNDYVAVAQLDGKEVYIDPGEKMSPFGMLHWKHSLASGFRLGHDKAALIAHTPSVNYKSSVVQRIADLTVDESGNVKGTIRVVFSGQEALHWRQIALENDPEEVKKKFNEWMHADLPQGVDSEFDHSLGLDQYDSNLLGIVKVSGILGTATGKRFFLPGQFFASKAKHPFVSEDKRVIPVDVHYGRSVQDDVTYHLPAGYQLESGPKPDKIAWPDHATFSITTEAQESRVNVVRDMSYSYTIVNPKDYSSLHDFYQKVAQADQEQLVLTRPTAAKN